MDDHPAGTSVSCPLCDAIAYAIVPEQSEIVEEGENADGKVRVNCGECGEQFLAYYGTS